MSTPSRTHPVDLPPWTDAWRNAAEAAPPPALESRVLAAFDARMRAAPRPRWRRPLTLALAAGLGLAAVFGALRLPHGDLPTAAATASNESNRSTTPAAPVPALDVDALRGIDSALLLAHSDGGVDDEALEALLWQARAQLLAGREREAEPTDGDADLLAL